MGADFRAYNYTITYKPGLQHGNADLLSGLPLPGAPKEVPLPGDTIHLLDNLQVSPISVAQIKRWMASDPILSKVSEMLLYGRTVKDTADEFQPYLRRREELSLQDGCILRGNRVMVPEVACQRILEELHEGHPGIS